MQSDSSYKFLSFRGEPRFAIAAPVKANRLNGYISISLLIIRVRDVSRNAKKLALIRVAPRMACGELTSFAEWQIRI